jgi:hypothetical protein
MPLWDADNRLVDDPCAILARLRDNESISSYKFYDAFGRCGRTCKDRKDALSQFAGHHPTMQYWDGYGIAPCDVDGDSQLKHDSRWTNPKEKQQLPKRVFTSVPDLARGKGHVNVESMLISGEDTSDLKQCARLAEVPFDRFNPGVQVQCVDHIVPTWTWGGDSSRDITRTPAFLKSIGYDVDAETSFTCSNSLLLQDD